MNWNKTNEILALILCWALIVLIMYIVYIDWGVRPF